LAVCSPAAVKEAVAVERRRKGRPVRPDVRLGLPDFRPDTRRGGARWGPRGARQGRGDRKLAVARLAARVSSSHRRDWPLWPSAYIGLDANVYLLTMQGPPARAPALRFHPNPPKPGASGTPDFRQNFGRPSGTRAIDCP